MLILAIETSTAQSSVALIESDRVLASATLALPQRHGEYLAPAIHFCLDQAGRTPAKVTGVAVGQGPGLYTGLRVGLATARTFASALGLPVVGLSGLDVLAFQARHVRRLLCAVIDARRSELFWAFYRTVPGGVQRQTELRVGAPGKLAGEIDALGEECLVLGDGAGHYADELRDVGAEIVAETWPDAAHLGLLSLPKFWREETCRPAEVKPIYLRHADARINWQTRGRFQGGQG